MNILTLKELNGSVQSCNKLFIDEAETQYRERIAAVADALLARGGDLPIVLISGPSGSGKTTAALRLATLLERAGRVVHTLSMDNYFYPLDDPRNERDEDGQIDFESPKRLDMELLNDHLLRLWRCEEIDVPTFDFANQKRGFGKKMKRGAGEFVILEGIHALNPEITGNIGEHATTVYVSVRTRLENAAGELLHPSKIRLTRRLVRDRLFRGRSAAETLDFFRHVERGEERFILPYKDKALYDIDTFISYEAAVYQPLVLPELIKVKETYPDYDRYLDLERFLAEIVPLERDAVPLDSLVREFVGGSHYRY
ncbi:MAG: hypothetical protein NC084_10565 [Bacteroides sp.]|nr:nucleoside kinase [Eubacterium sp.]MCM1419278.1 nucleoside kinase [Roseburia sp.]MCM1463140.1 hypothetical protein [Bacteroides sp.]